MRPPLEIDLRQIPSDSALAQLKAAGFEEPFAIITAFDPQGRNLSDAENQQLERELDGRISATGYRFMQVDCCSPDRSHCERSIAVTMPQGEALDLGREMEQVAIFWFDGKRFWILGAIVETDPLMLPRRS